MNENILSEMLILLHDIKAELMDINEALKEIQPTHKQAVSDEDLRYLQEYAESNIKGNPQKGTAPLKDDKATKAFITAAEQIKNDIK